MSRTRSLAQDRGTFDETEEPLKDKEIVELAERSDAPEGSPDGSITNSTNPIRTTESVSTVYTNFSTYSAKDRITEKFKWERDLSHSVPWSFKPEVSSTVRAHGVFHRVLSIVTVPNSTCFFSSGSDMTVQMWNVEYGAINWLSTYSGHNKNIVSLCLTEDNQIVSCDEELHIWNYCFEKSWTYKNIILKKCLRLYPRTIRIELLRAHQRE
eukprot:UN27390